MAAIIYNYNEVAYLTLIYKDKYKMKEDYYGVGIIPEDSMIGKLYFHEIE
jgi:hypothetical protein